VEHNDGHSLRNSRGQREERQASHPDGGWEEEGNGRMTDEVVVAVRWSLDIHAGL